MPLALRSDHGVETTLLAGTQYLLASEAHKLRLRRNRRETTRSHSPRATDPAIVEFNESGDHNEMEFADCFCWKANSHECAAP
ncbi:hypothetical protein N657DRAFT_651418 [Parathielavia appendiculata]|uniref:Uncharacterized protein n=1 Tax=Parathielavia appendiculata TaxID=2587402 RepID=A0AAN6TPH3_9PEZI|nr:hypothetical protein N657DRAFT_651418 [Parathielavia appendiculata]